MSIDLAALETRVKTVTSGVYSALERDAHTKVGEIVLDAAKDLLPFVPEGQAAENLIEQLVGVATQAHNSIHDAAGTSDPLAAAGDVAALVTDGKAAVKDVQNAVDGQPVEGNAGSPA